MVATGDALRSSVLAVANAAGVSMIGVLCGSAAFNTASSSDVQLAPFEQLRAVVVGLVERGQLECGSRLPAVRQLSADLALAPGTVSRAFRELEADGVVETRGRHGTFVTGLPRRSVAQREQRVRVAIEELVAAAAAAGLDEGELVRRVRAAFG